MLRKTSTPMKKMFIQLQVFNFVNTSEFDLYVRFGLFIGYEVCCSDNDLGFMLQLGFEGTPNILEEIVVQIVLWRSILVIHAKQVHVSNKKHKHD